MWSFMQLAQGIMFVTIAVFFVYLTLSIHDVRSFVNSRLDSVKQTLLVK